MSSNKGLYIGLVILFAGIIVLAGLKANVVGQATKIESAKAAGEKLPAASSEAARSKATRSEATRLSASAKPASEAELKPMAAAGFESAAARNSQLQIDLRWVFGGKSQRGWRLYTPLISSIIASEGGADSSDFAFALSRWQKERGIESSGVLDNATWFEMISWLQSRRIKDRVVPTGDQVVTIPVSESYDPSRPEALRKVERETYEAYKRMLAAAAADPTSGLKVNSNGELEEGEKYFKIISAMRTREYQNHLRKQSPNSGRAGLAVNSPHFTGRALDIYVGGEPVSTKDDNRAIQTQTRAYKWLVKNAGRFGFRPYFYEPWHWEYVPNK